MSGASRRTTAGLLARHLGAGGSTSVLLAVLVGIAVLVTALIPRAIATLSQAELQHHLTALSPLRIDLTATGRLGAQDTFGDPQSGEEVFATLERDLSALPSQLEDPLPGILDRPEWIAKLTRIPVRPQEPRTIVPIELSLTFALRWQDRVRFLDGAAPGPWDDPDAEPMEIAVSRNAATQMGLEVGDLIDSQTAPLLVSGVYEPIDPDDRYWAHAFELRQASEVRGPGGAPILTASVMVDPLNAVPLDEELHGADLRVWYPTVIDDIRYADAPSLLVATQKLTALGSMLSNGQLLEFRSRLSDEIATVVDRVAAITALLALTGSAPLGVLVAVLALGVRVVLERRRSVLALAAARGATAIQLRTAMLIEGLIITVPVSAAAIGISALMPAAVGPEALVVPLLVAIATPVLFVIATSARQLRPGRADLGTSVRGRWVVEAVVVGLAALAVVLLFRRGLVTATASLGFDPLLSAAPLLLALATCVVVLRLYPPLLRALQRRLRRSRGAVGMLGAARAVRQPAGSFGTVLAIVVAVSAAVFSLVVGTTIATGLAVTARESVGADIRVEAPALPAAVVEQIARVPGVRDAVGYEIVPGLGITMGFDRVSVDAVFAELVTLDRMRPDLGADGGTDGTGIPFLASPDVADRLSDRTTTIEGEDAVQMGIVRDGALPGTARNWVLVDARYAPDLIGAQITPGTVLVDVEPGSDVAGVRDAVAELVTASLQQDQRDSVEIVDAVRVLAEAAARPTTAGLSAALALAAALSLLLGMLAIVLGSVAATGARNRMVGVLRMLGMTPRQVRGLVAWELTPLAVASVAAGTALGLAMSFIVAGVLDLRPFAGGTAVVPTTVPVTLVAAVSIGFAAVVIAAGFVAIATARRISPAVTVKMGAE